MQETREIIDILANKANISLQQSKNIIDTQIYNLVLQLQNLSFKDKKQLNKIGNEILNMWSSHIKYVLSKYQRFNENKFIYDLGIITLRVLKANNII